MQQLSGINVTSYYLPTVLINSVGLTEKMARLLAASNSVSYFLFSLIGIPNVERWGRRNMMIFAATGQSFCYFIITILIRFNEEPGYAHTKEVASASVACEPHSQFQTTTSLLTECPSLLLILCVLWNRDAGLCGGTDYDLGADKHQGVPWLYPTEINSLSMRTKGAAVGTATNWIFNFMGVMPARAMC